MTEAHAENGDSVSKSFHERNRVARLLRPARAWRYDQPIKTTGVLGPELVSPDDRRVGAELAEILHEVEGKRVVIVENKHTH
jgi:hypothetical protein